MTADRPSAPLRCVPGREFAYTLCNGALLALRKALSTEYAEVEGLVIRAMIRCGIAEVAA